MKRWIATCLLLTLSCFAAIAQSFPNLKFNQISVKDGLSTNAVRCTYEDKNGIIWIATGKGLNRYQISLLYTEIKPCSITLKVAKIKQEQLLQFIYPCAIILHQKLNNHYE